jgi:phosphatidylglycerol lysyltransferase
MARLGLGFGTSFDLDFHTIPSYGEDALVEKHYVSKRSRRQKGGLAFTAATSSAPPLPRHSGLGYARLALGLLLFALALWAMHRALHGYPPRELARAVASVPAGNLALAAVLSALNYFVLTGYDALAFGYLGNPLPYRKVALASFAGYAFANNTGSFSILAGGGVRYRLYAAWGLSAADIARVVAFCTVTFWLGFLTLAGLAFVIEPLAVPAALRIPGSSLRGLGAVFLILVAGYLAWGAARRGPLRIRNWEIEVPPFSQSAAQISLSAADCALAAGILFSLLPVDHRPSFALFLGFYLLAQVVGLGSTVPGGLGVFEGAMVLLLAPFLSAADAVGPLVAFRVLYYLLPLLAAALALAAHELYPRRSALGRAALALGGPLSRVVPQILGLAAFGAGCVLLLSGASPALESRMGWLRHAVPLPAVEISHFTGSLAGAGLLVLARALQHRVSTAYALSVALLALGIATSLLKGLDYEQALVLALLLAALLPFRRQFHRKAFLTAEILSLRWAAAVASVLGGSVWLGLLGHHNVEYSHELWWRSAFAADAPRFLRATVGAVVVVLVAAVARLLRRDRPRVALPAPEEMETAAAIASRSPATDGYLALLGDKELLFSPVRDAFIMYGVRRRSWVALGDPVGPADRVEELLWAFRDLSDRYGGRPVFYDVGAEHLPLYLDIGLTPLKIGEAGRVPLEGFSLDGSAGKALRAARNHMLGEGCSFAIVPVDEARNSLPELKAVSDAWLEAKRTREKGFSLGFFRPDYLQRFPCALIRRGAELVAFANLWPGAGKEELSVDLMRFRGDAPNGLMDYLFTELLLWGADEGYRWFNLGMAPLSAFEDPSLAPLWNRLGAILFRHGEHFHDFQGLRAYKEQFDPVWAPRYLLTPGGVTLPRILLDIAALVSGGGGVVVAK